MTSNDSHIDVPILNDVYDYWQALYDTIYLMTFCQINNDRLSGIKDDYRLANVLLTHVNVAKDINLDLPEKEKEHYQNSKTVIL